MQRPSTPQIGKLAVTLFLILSLDVRGQSDSQRYSTLIKAADSLLYVHKYCQAAKVYNQAFVNKNSYSTDIHHLEAALAWAKCGIHDSAFVSLYVLVHAFRFADTALLSTMFKNNPIFKRKEFRQLFASSARIAWIKTKALKPEVSKLLDSLYIIDQSSRTLGMESQKLSADLTNKSQVNIIDSLYKVYGWLSPEEVGYRASQTQFLIIQHADLSTQLKWLPIIKEAVDSSLAPPDQYALLLDRTLIRTGKPQVYGTQLFYSAQKKRYQPLPVREGKTLNKRKLQLGMPSIENYLSTYR